MLSNISSAVTPRRMEARPALKAACTVLFKDVIECIVSREKTVCMMNLMYAPG